MDTDATGRSTTAAKPGQATPRPHQAAPAQEPTPRAVTHDLCNVNPLARSSADPGRATQADRSISRAAHTSEIHDERASTTVDHVETLERETRDVIAEALAIIDKNLGSLVQRELVSSAEITDLLLDVRSLLTEGHEN
jgi:hypothetical protein